MGIPRRPRSAVVAAPPPPVEEEPQAPIAAPPAQQAPPPPPLAARPVDPAFAPPVPAAPAPPRAAPVAAPAPAPVTPRAPAAPARPLPLIAAEAATCTKCGLATTRTNVVFSRGNPEAKLLFIGEAPGADEDEQGLPFVGRAGQLLDRMIGAMGLDPAKDVYVANIIKCRPPGNRKPEPIEVETCIPYLHEQIAVVDPKVIVALGNTAVAALLNTKLGITKVRGQWKLYRGKIQVMPTYHPSYLLRPSPQQVEAKKQTWEDLQAVMKELGLPPKK
jgi:DNA polymerase